MTDRYSFDLLSEPWLPVLDSSGAPSQVGLIEAFELSQSIYRRDPWAEHAKQAARYQPLADYDGRISALQTVALHASDACATARFYAALGFRPMYDKRVEDMEDFSFFSSTTIPVQSRWRPQRRRRRAAAAS